MAARFGGEEFSLVLPQADPVEAAGVAERLRKEIFELSFTGEIEALKISTSIGLASIPHPKIICVDDLLKAADNALYEAKNNGRNRVEIA